MNLNTKSLTTTTLTSTTTIRVTNDTLGPLAAGTTATTRARDMDMSRALGMFFILLIITCNNSLTITYRFATSTPATAYTHQVHHHHLLHVKDNNNHHGHYITTYAHHHHHFNYHQGRQHLWSPRHHLPRKQCTLIITTTISTKDDNTYHSCHVTTGTYLTNGACSPPPLPPPITCQPPPWHVPISTPRMTTTAVTMSPPTLQTAYATTIIHRQLEGQQRPLPAPQHPSIWQWCGSSAMSPGRFVFSNY